jgi:plastocyanin
MNKYFLFIVLLLFLIGCGRSKVLTPEQETVEEVDVVEEVEEEKVELPDELKGKKISDIVGNAATSDFIDIAPVVEPVVEEVNETEEVEEKVELPENTRLIELQMFGESMQFFPKNLEVSVGDTVRWINKLEYHDRRAKVSVYAKHNTMFKSHLMVYGEFYEYVFEEKGVFYYGAVPYESFFKTGSITVG